MTTTKTATNGERVTLNGEGRFIDSAGRYGYAAHFGGAWICYTDGHLCECREEETARRDGGDIVCPCDNTASLGTGFETCLVDGTLTAPDKGGLWDGLHLTCNECHRVINQETLEIV